MVQLQKVQVGHLLTNTGQEAKRMTCSVMLPIKSRLRPLWPWVPITIRSQDSSRATRLISWAGSPAARRYFVETPAGAGTDRRRSSSRRWRYDSGSR